MFLGAVGGVAMSHLPGLPLVPAVAMGIGAMSVTMLRLPLTSVLLATLLLGVRRTGRDTAGDRGGRRRLRRRRANRTASGQNTGSRIRAGAPPGRPRRRTNAAPATGTVTVTAGFFLPALPGTPLALGQLPGAHLRRARR